MILNGFCVWRAWTLCFSRKIKSVSLLNLLCVVWDDADSFRNSLRTIQHIQTLSQRCGNTVSFQWAVTCAGELEVVLDRRLQQDDNRGLGQGVTDNKLTASLYHLLLEDRRGGTRVRGRGHQSLKCDRKMERCVLQVILMMTSLNEHSGSFFSNRKGEEPQLNISHCSLTWPHSPSATRHSSWSPVVTASFRSSAPSCRCARRCRVTFTCWTCARWRTRR